jgi:single-stranded-DNA-specific exonuclease
LILSQSAFEANMETVIKKRWEFTPRITGEVEENLKAYSHYLRQILFSRGCMNAQQAQCFLASQAPSMTDPFSIKDMDIAIDRLLVALKQEELIAVYGDYDVDGVTATVLLVEALRVSGARVKEYIPHRYDEGYGLNNDALEALYNQGVRLVVTVDCGARSVGEAEFARSLGLDMIISDHHQPGLVLPPAIALINPRQPGDTYPDKDLTGVGLAYKIAQALLSRQPAAGVQVEDWLDLVALGTVADLAPLKGENRAMVSAGLEQIHAQKRQGIHSLCGSAGLNDTRATAGDIGFILGPRLNAAGRMDSAMAAFELLETSDPMEAGKLAQALEVSNYERQTTTRAIQAKAAEIALAGSPDAHLIFAADPEFKEGIVGLAAARLVETYYRPAIVAHQGETETRASCRSIPDFHITEALDQCADLLVRYGGHKAAAGFTVKNENLPELVDRLHAIANEKLGGKDLQPVLRIENELHLAQQTGEDLKQILFDIAKLQPTGIENPEPLFCSRNLVVKRAQAVGKDQSHLRLTVADNRGVLYNGIAFRQGDWAGRKPDRVDLVYALEINDYQGQQSIQFNIKDIKAVAG